MKTFAKNYKKLKPYGYTGKNGYNEQDKLAVIINKKAERQKIKKEIKQWEK